MSSGFSRIVNSGVCMAWPSSLQVALKEWASVCRALERGTQVILLRKGGIYETACVENTPEYSGCKSWVPLNQTVETGNAVPVLDDLKYEFKRKGILERIDAMA